MKLSERLRSHRWRLGSLNPGDHGWDYSDDPIKAADLLDKLETLLYALRQSISKSKRFDDELESRVRILLAELEGTSVRDAVSAYYILEDKKRRLLPLNVDEAIEILREEFIAGHTHGSLCVADASGNLGGDVIEARGEHDWAAFESRARAWLARAIDQALIRRADV
jgi:hypothetical protein